MDEWREANSAIGTDVERRADVAATVQNERYEAEAGASTTETDSTATT